MTRIPKVYSSEVWPTKVKLHTVTFVRHGEKAGDGFMADLTLKGRRDAVEAGRRIGCNVDLFLASPSPRTVSTAEGIREGNGSSAKIVLEEQLAEPGMGASYDFRYAMKSFFTQILRVIQENRAEVTVATTHDYVVGYVAQVMGSTVESKGFLCGITINLESLSQICEQL